MRKFVTAMLIVCATAAFAQGAIQVTPTAAKVYADAAGTIDLPMESLVGFIADVDGDGFGAIGSLQPFEITVDDDDVFLGSGTSGSVLPGLIQNPINLPNVDASLVGKQMMMIWFNTPGTPGETGAEAGTSYGVYTAAGFEVPGSLGSFTLDSLITSDFGGTLDPGTFVAPFTVVPEPASALLAALGAGLILVRRRRA